MWTVKKNKYESKKQKGIGKEKREEEEEHDEEQETVKRVRKELKKRQQKIDKIVSDTDT